VADGPFFRTEDGVIRHIWAMSKRGYGAWPGYVAVEGGFMATYEDDPLPVLPDEYDDDGQADDDATELDEADELDGPWHDSWPDDDEAA
jgi:hypothetical protein